MSKRMVIVSLVLLALVVCTAGLAEAAAMKIAGHPPRAVLLRAPVVSAVQAETAGWLYNGELNVCYPATALGLAGFVPVTVCPAGAFKGYLYNPKTYECFSYPDLSVSYGDPWQWRAACPGPGPEPPACPDPRDQLAVQVTGVLRADGFGVHELQLPPGPETPCLPGDLRVTSEGIFVCVATNAWGKSELKLQ